MHLVAIVHFCEQRMDITVGSLGLVCIVIGESVYSSPLNATPRLSKWVCSCPVVSAVL